MNLPDNRGVSFWPVVTLMSLAACKPGPSSAPTPPPVAPAPNAPRATSIAPDGSSGRAALLLSLQAELVQRHGEAQRERIQTGLAQVAALWRPTDGDLAAFARAQFIAAPAALEATLARLEAALEQIDGHLNEIGRELLRPNDTDSGPLWPVDGLLGGFDPGAHVVEDLFQNGTAFAVLLNFPQTTLQQRLQEGPRYSRRQWAEVRLSGRFMRRVPGDVQQRIAAATAAGERYIASYNIWMHHLLDAQGQRPFPKALRLISHWNLRDEIRADYNDRNGLQKQRLIAKVMERIVEQSIPAAVIDNPRVDWSPLTNAVTLTPPAEIEAEAPSPATQTTTGDLAAREPDTRYALLLDNFAAQRLADPYSPSTPTLIRRSFELGREIPEERVVAMLTEICASPLARRVAERIAARLGRPLEPHDLWYSGFRATSRFPQAELDQLTAKRYPTALAFEADIPHILELLGFSQDKAAFVASHIRVDAARGAGHAMPALRRGDFPRLRTRVGKTGMDYKGYNIAVHELGHNVEQVFSLYGVDRPLLMGVPNNAFTEALAFVFQQRDLELLGLGKPDPEAYRIRVLNDFFVTWEIAGVALVEIAAWHYMYDHPAATPAQLRAEVVRLARQIWNRYYAPVLGGQDALLLGVYSHMIQNTLYLPDYPLGHLIAFQIEEHLLRQPPSALGREFERMATIGSITPDLWLQQATGAPLSTASLLRATETALQ